MRTLSSTLLAAQRSASAQPYLRVRLFDRDVGVAKLRWSRRYTGSEADGPCAGVVTGDGALLRARIDPTGGALSHQRVASPSESSDYTAWTSLGTVGVAPRLGLAAAGTRALLASVRTDGVSVEVRESTDSGASFGASAVAVTAGGTVTAVACALLDGTGSAAVLYAVAGVVYAVTRSGTGAWSTPAAWSHTLASVSGLAARGWFDYELMVSGIDGAGTAGVWATRLGAGAALPAGTWDQLAALVEAAAGTSVTYLATGLAAVDVARAALVESYSGGGAYDRVQLASGPGDSVFGDFHWRDPLPFEHASPYGVGAAGTGTDGWLVAPHGVWHAAVTSGSVDLSGDVLEADLEQSRGGGRLRLVLRNEDGRYLPESASVALEARGELRVDPGYVTPAGAEWSTGMRYWIASVRRRHARGSATLELEAIDEWGVLREWVAPRQLVWAAGSLPAWRVLDALMLRAGVRLATSGSSEATALTPAFTVRPGERGATAVRRLLDALPDEVRPDGGALRPFEPLPGDATDYAYGEDHPLLAASVAAASTGSGWARVFGAGVFAEAVDEAALRVGASSVIAVDDNLAVQARADVRAATLLRQAALSGERGEIVVVPNVGQELGDVIEVTDATLGLTAQRFRVAALRLRLTRQGPRPRYEQTLTLSEV